jgi:hypothetical protein
VADPLDPRLILNDEGAAALRERVSLEEVAAAWCRYMERSMRQPNGTPEWEDDEDGWAAEIYFEDDFWDVSRRRTFVRLIAALAPNDDVLLTVGAQDLEDLISDDEDCLQWIEEQAASSRNFKHALQNVYADGLKPGTVARLERAAGTLRHKAS